jgi:hypothetical protein
MPYAFIRQNVEDYTKWKAGFDNDVDVRQAGGSIGAQVFRDADGSNTVSILIEFKDVESLQAMMERMQTPEMQKLMADAGVMGAPEAVYTFSGAEKTAA